MTGIPDEQRERWRQLPDQVSSVTIGLHRATWGATSDWIAEARQAVPALLAENEAQAAELVDLRGRNFEAQGLARERTEERDAARLQRDQLRAQVAELTAKVGKRCGVESSDGSNWLVCDQPMGHDWPHSCGDLGFPQNFVAKEPRKR